MDLRGRVALLTGGARMGEAVGLALAERGCDVALSYRSSRAAAEASRDRIAATGRRAMVVQADACDEAQVRAAVAAVDGAYGRLDVLVCMASTYDRTPWASLDDAAWQAGVDGNLRGAWLFARAAAPILARHGGRIVTIADWLPASGRPRYRGYTPYYVGKMGVLGLTQALALELAPDVLVNAVAPGPILPPPDLTPDESAEVAKATPLGRWGGAEEIARAVLFLVETDFVTGECIRVDGGRHLV